MHNQGIDLRVQDTGIGIVPDERGRIFEAFFRGSNIGVVSGLGLGLTIAKAGIELHQGTITVESRLGHGTTVHIWLPLRPA
ncbi:MAG: HAMP domain-containing histidine kinase [Chloroflexi bacterium]|nr:HAMP domain-containing histidine kinase [Chloroflexota bacterium]